MDLPELDERFIAAPVVGAFAWFVRFLFRIQQVTEQRFEALLDRYRQDLEELRHERDADREQYSAELADVRKKLDDERHERDADRAQYSAELADVRKQLDDERHDCARKIEELSKALREQGGK